MRSLFLQGFQKQNQYRKFYYQSSTFLHAFDPPVYMSDDEDSQDYYGSIDSQSQADSTDDIMDDTVSVCITYCNQLATSIRNMESW